MCLSTRASKFIKEAKRQAAAYGMAELRQEDWPEMGRQSFRDLIAKVVQNTPELRDCGFHTVPVHNTWRFYVYRANKENAQ